MRRILFLTLLAVGCHGDAAGIPEFSGDLLTVEDAGPSSADLSTRPPDLSSPLPDLAAPCVPTPLTGHWTDATTDNDQYYSVWGLAANNVYAVGRPGGKHWNGATWVYDVPGLAAGAWYGVWGSAANDVFIVGTDIKHWNGSFWENLAMAGGGTIGLGGSGPMYAISGVSTDELWMVGDWTNAAHRTPGGWSAVATNAGSILKGVWVASSTDAWAVGATGVIVHWDGANWAKTNPAPATMALAAIWGSGADDVWAVGSGGLLLHYNGSGWSRSSSSTSASLAGVWGTGRDDVWAVGGGGTAVHFDGCAWSAVPTGTTTDLTSVWGTSPGDYWAVGSPAAVLHFTP